MIITTQEDLVKMYDRLIANCDKAINNSTDDWARDYWKSTKEKLYQNMSKIGLLEGSKTVH